MGTLRERERENWLGGTALLAICCDGEWICIHTYRSELTVAEAVTHFRLWKTISLLDYEFEFLRRLATQS